MSRLNCRTSPRISSISTFTVLLTLLTSSCSSPLGQLPSRRPRDPSSSSLIEACVIRRGQLVCSSTLARLLLMKTSLLSPLEDPVVEEQEEPPRHPSSTEENAEENPEETAEAVEESFDLSPDRPTHVSARRLGKSSSSPTSFSTLRKRQDHVFFRFGRAF